MASGLKIKHDNSHLNLRIGMAALFIMFCVLTVFYGLRWYNTGETGPIPLPVAAAGPMIDEQPISPKELVSFTAEPSAPRYLSIPVLGIDRARIIGVDIDSKNRLPMPDNIHDAGWYKNSVAPGSGTGAVLLNGRSAGQRTPGLFARADSLQAGDMISIQRGDGQQVDYEVYDVRSMPVAQVYSTGLKEMMLSAKPDKEGLGIVVASGNWVPKLQEYDRRIMIRAVHTE